MKKKDTVIQEPLHETVLLKSMDTVMHESMIPYAEHVILERALPRVEDGLKPVQRRILYTMRELQLDPDKPHRKSARIVGDCLGKYHPHGDSSVYEAMVHLAQDFSMSLPLVDGHGNFGSMDGDKAAAMRYTEARMTPAALQMLRDIDEDTVEWTDNFDDTLKEPVLLPGSFPNLLINGSSGIAVGLATNIPPHNPGEAIDAVIAQLKEPEISLDALLKLMPAPDFPTGACLIDSPEIRAAYETGRGKLTVRAKTEIETLKNGKKNIVITEIPFGVNKAAMLQGILELTEQKKSLLSGITDIRDESDRTGLRAVIEVKKDADAEKILRVLFKYSDLQVTFGANFTAIADGKPRQLGLKDVISYYIRHRKTVLTRRTAFRLEAAKKRRHILEGLMVAVDHVDEVIRLIRASKNPKAAKAALMEAFSLSEVQAQAILDLRLQRLTSLELISIEREYKDILKLIKELEEILGSEKKLNLLLEKELTEVKKLFPVPRRTAVIADTGTETEEKEIEAAEEVAVALLPGLKVRRVPERLFKAEDFAQEAPLYLFHTKTDAKLRLFTDRGAVLHIAVKEIPETRPSGKAGNLAALLPFDTGESILFADGAPETGSYLFFTANGQVKASEKKEYVLRTKKTTALTLKEGDTLRAVTERTGEDILLITVKGQSVRFADTEVPAQGRISGGVRGIRLNEGDSVLFGGTVSDEGEMLLLTDRGYAKRCFLFDYELQGRGGKGVKTFDLKKNGANGRGLVFALPVKDPVRFAVTQRQSGSTEYSSEGVLIEKLASRGSLLVPVMLDDDVLCAVKI